MRVSSRICFTFTSDTLENSVDLYFHSCKKFSLELFSWRFLVNDEALDKKRTMVS